MYLVKTYIEKSTIHGMGVFAGEDIAKGTLVWDFVEGLDQSFTQAQYDALADVAKKYLEYYGWWNNGLIYKCGDHGSYTNHSDTPNTGNWPNTHSMAEVALRDIKKGEEITSDYRSFDEISRENLSKVLAR